MTDKIEKIVAEMLRIYGIPFTDPNSRQIAIESWARQFDASIASETAKPDGCEKCGHEGDGHYSTCPTASRVDQYLDNEADGVVFCGKCGAKR